MNVTPIRIILAEDHTIVRKGLRALLENAPDIEVVAEAANGRMAIEQVAELNPDVIVMDITMPLLNGLEATRQLKDQYPELKVVILTMHSDEEYVFQSLRAGVDGYLVKETAPLDLVKAIRAAYRGNSYLSPNISKTVIAEYIRQAEKGLEPSSLFRLTKREREILQLVAEGTSIARIAELLHISEKTVRIHRSNLMSKLDLHNAAEITLYAVRHGIISLGDDQL
jgi:DNA-binding NarL/FixJ family response regulator